MPFWSARSRRPWLLRPLPWYRLLMRIVSLSMRNAISIWLLYIGAFLPFVLLLALSSTAKSDDKGGWSAFLGIVIGLPMTVVATLLATLAAEGWKASLWQVLRRLSGSTIPALWGIGWRGPLALIPAAIFCFLASLIFKWLGILFAILLLTIFAVTFGVAIVVVVMEDAIRWGAMKRSWSLVRKEIGMALVVGVCLVPNTAISLGASVLPPDAAGLFGLLGFVMLPLFFTAPVGLYLNTRCRFEAYHLETLRQET